MRIPGSLRPCQYSRDWSLLIILMFRTILSSLDYLRHPFSISVFGGLMYWSEWDTHAIYQVQQSVCDTTIDCKYSDVSGWQVVRGQCDDGDQHWQCPPSHGGPGNMIDVMTNYLCLYFGSFVRFITPSDSQTFPTSVSLSTVTAVISACPHQVTKRF